MKHTPGPWNVTRLATPDYAPEFAIYTNTNVTVDGTIHHNQSKDIARVIGDNSEANAHIIAAAPDLLAALQELLADRYLADPINDARMCNAKAAVGKAKGD